MFESNLLAYAAYADVAASYRYPAPNPVVVEVEEIIAAEARTAKTAVNPFRMDYFRARVLPGNLLGVWA